jgi:type IV pilus assembly protein PilW
MNKSIILKKRRGFTLVEILVALAIGALLTSGFIEIFSSSKKTYMIQDNLSRLQENARFAMDFLARDIRMAGHINNAVPSSTFNGVAITGCEGNDCFPGGNSGDAIVVSYNANPAGPLDCLGQNIAGVAPVPGRAQNAFYVRNESLMCLGNGNAVPQPLVEGIEDMQILYGEDTTPNNGDFIANRYLQADDVNLNMNNVVSVRIVLSVRTLDDNLALQDTANVNSGVLDSRIRRTFTKTIGLRNRIN